MDNIYETLIRFSPIWILYFGMLIGGIVIINDEEPTWKYNNIFWKFFIYNVIGIPACICSLGIMAMGGIFFWTGYCIMMTIGYFIYGIWVSDFYNFYIYSLLTVSTLYTFWAFNVAINYKDRYKGYI